MMLHDNRGTNFEFVTEPDTFTKQDTVEWGDDCTMAERVRALYQLYFWCRDARRAGFAAKVVIGHIGTQEPTLMLAERMTWALQRLADHSHDWVALLKGGLVGLYLEIVTDPGFFTEDVKLVDMFVLGYVSVVQHSFHDSELSEDLLSRAPGLWKSIWDSRDCIRAWPRGERSPAFQGTAKYTEPLASLLACYHALYWQRYSSSPPFDTYMPHVGLLLWERTKGRSDLSCSASLCLKTLNVFNDERTPEFVEACREFTQDAIVNGIGLESFRVRFEQEARRLFSPRAQDVADLDYANWSLFHIPMKMPEVYSYLMRFDTLAVCVELCNALSRERCLHKGAYALTFEMAHQIFSEYLRYWRDHVEQNIILRGNTAVDIVARALEVTARIATGDGYTSMGEDVLRRVCQDIQNLISIVQGALEESDPRQARAARFTAECRVHAPSQWHPSLSLFDTAIQRGALSKSIHRHLRQLWVDFGAALGLKEDEERARLARQMRTHCAWPACIYHTSEPGRALATCKGCGQVRYCGKVCQTDHWKAGHKQDCGNRLKD